ncbi:MAG: VOC family protein, partial [Caulobacterales bacterium]|nr:VOC family protein [Caulobacterales bacterium]
MARSIVSHVSVGVADVAKARAFYGAVLAPLGVGEQEVIDTGSGPVAVAYGDGFPEFWVQLPIDGAPAGCGNGVHIGLVAPSEEAVDAFHAAALEAGGVDEGAPGLRPRYTPDYYGAF